MLHNQAETRDKGIPSLFTSLTQRHAESHATPPSARPACLLIPSCVQYCTERSLSSADTCARRTLGCHCLTPISAGALRAQTAFAIFSPCSLNSILAIVIRSYHPITSAASSHIDRV